MNLENDFLLENCWVEEEKYTLGVGIGGIEQGCRHNYKTEKLRF